MAEINHGVVQQLKDELRENFYHPLDRFDTPDFLESLTHWLCSESKFIMIENDEPGRDDKIVTRWAPVYFIRKRIGGMLSAIDEIIKTIEKTGYVPKPITEIFGSDKVEIQLNDSESSIDEQLAALNGENVDILLAKEANREQLEIAQRIEHYNAVLVQGPPGTGKTYTIANLLGHFLAQGKSVLVTSYTKKALSVLKSQVPEEIQNLCVSVLDDTNEDMVRSIDGISENISRYTSRELKRKIETTAIERNEIIKQLSEVRRKIYTIKYRESEPIVYNYNGESYSPSKAAEFVNQYAKELSYILGKVRLYYSLPVSIDELRMLYQSNADITYMIEHELACDLPNPQSLITPAKFSADIAAEAECLATLDSIGEALPAQIKCDYNNCIITAEDNYKKYVLAQNPSKQALDEIEEYIDSFSSIDDWMIQAAVDGYKGGGYRQKWEMLISAIEDMKNSKLRIQKNYGIISKTSLCVCS